MAFLGTPGLPGASSNANPGSITGNIGGSAVNISVPTFGGLFQSDPGSTMDNLSQAFQNSPGAFSIPNLLSNASNAIFGTNLGTSAIDPGKNAGMNNSTLSDLFLRSVIIILGFIFVAVGLSMFRGNEFNIITRNADPLRGFKKGVS